MNIVILQLIALLSLSCRLNSRDCVIVKVIGRSLHNLEELFLGDLMNDSFDAIECLVTGCPKLKILHVGLFAPLESVHVLQHLLLGLPNLIEFKHPLMVHALEKIIRDGKADSVSSLCTLYIGDIGDIADGTRDTYGVTNVCNSAQVVINHLINITKLIIIIIIKPCEESLTTLSVTVSSMCHLTELSWTEYSCTDTIVPVIEVVGHRLRVLDLCVIHYSTCSLDVIDQCRKLRVLRIGVRFKHPWNNMDPSYGSDPQEEVTPFHHLQELDLWGLNRSHLKPALLKSLIASPVLQDVRLIEIPIFTDHIVKAAFSHVNEEGEQLAFTSLRKLELDSCDSITNYLENVVTHERVPLEMLIIDGCSGLTERLLWNMERFDLAFKNYED